MNKKIIYWIITAFLLVGGWLLLENLVGNSSLHAQQEVTIHITEGVPLVPVAIPEFTVKTNSPAAQTIKSEIYDTLCNDLQYSRVFKLIPKDYYSYIPKFTPDNIRFKDWASIQANILIVGEIDAPTENRIVFSMNVYDVQSEKFIFSRNFGGEKEFTRLIAHRGSDEMMKYFGEKPIFTTKLVFVSSRDGNNEVYVMDYDGARQKRITFNNFLDMLPSWSSDNEKILYTSYKQGTPDLLMYNLFTGKTETLASRGTNYSADWSPEADRIVYTSTRSGNAEIYVRDMKTGKEKQLTFGKVIINSTPSWSPNGQEIVFTSQRSGTPQIYLMDAEGTNVRRITLQGGYHDSPVWSPDGTRIAYVSRIESRFDIYVFTIKDNTIYKLTESAGRNENPTWSPDGRHIIFASNRTGAYHLYSVDYDGTNLKQLTFHGENKMPKWQKK
ncbi:MAG: Tol-Pal system beta propeller repeat protein TolB [Candidatus Omnitrophota bacterium]